MIDDTKSSENDLVKKKPSIFTLTAKLASASDLINSISVESRNESHETLFSHVVHIICKSLLRLVEKDPVETSLLSAEEVEALMAELSLNTRQFTLVVDCCSYIMEQAAYLNCNPKSVYEDLILAGFSENHAQVLGQAWADLAPRYVAALKMRHKSIGYSSLQSSSYRVHIIMGQSGLLRVQEPAAIFELTLDSVVDPRAGSQSGESFGRARGDGRNKAGEIISMEFDHGELSAFFEQLGRVQSQIDALV
mmetsp:Transcript_32850/g.47437  ORF Transcript_32850/g.47437 Transcript_32850/m.47437 type:complete len:250 (-) Transcript_32850:88-837(-)